MIFHPLSIPGAFRIEIEPHADERGHFARTYCRREFERHGLNPDFVQCSVSFSRRRGTLRGMHYQAPPHAEAKLVRCTRGAIYDVVLDLRPGTPTEGAWCAIELHPESGLLVYVPEGCAHGFQTLEADTEVHYQMSAYHEPAASRGVRWDDPAFGIEWPDAERIIAPRDASYPDYRSPS